MPKALVIVMMKTGALTRGQVDAGAAGSAVSFVHTGVDLPGNYRAFVVTGTGAQLTSISNHANFLVGQQIAKNGEVYNWQDARTAIAPGARTTINNWLAANGKRALTAQDNIETLLQIFDPAYAVGRDDVWDAAP